MKNSAEPYALPGEPERGIAGILSFWQGLKRHGAEIPFWDDVKISDLPELSGALALIEVTERARFRFGVGVVGDDINTRYGDDLAGKFLDELDIRDPLRFLISQCSATLEAREPTYYRHGSPSRGGYARLIAPLWGNGRIEMLLAGFAWD